MKALRNNTAITFLPCLKELAHAKTLNLGRNVVFRSKLTFPISFSSNLLHSLFQYKPTLHSTKLFYQVTRHIIILTV